MDDINRTYTFVVMDKDMMKSDTVGNGTFQVPKDKAAFGTEVETTIMYKGKSAGKVWFKFD